MNILVIAPHGMYCDYTMSFVHNQCRAFAAAGHRVRAVVPLAFGKRSNEGKILGPVVEHLTQDGVEICYVRHLSLSSYGSLHFNPTSAKWMCRLFYRSILRDFRPDVVYGHTITFGGQLTPYFRRKFRIPSVLTTHGGDTDVSIRPENLPWARSICDQADTVAAVSSVYRSKTEQLHSSTRTMTVLNGFVVNHLSEQPRISTRIVQVGNLIERKKADVTVRAFAKLRETYPEMTLIEVGDGPLRPLLEALRAELHLDDCLTFFGHLSNRAALAEMAKAQFFVMPSVREGFGIVYLEAMASGCITIGTEGEGIADVIEHGKNGFLVPPDNVDAIADVIRWCLTHPEEAAAIAEKGKADALQLTWERNAAQYLALFETLKNH